MGGPSRQPYTDVWKAVDLDEVAKQASVVTEEGRRTLQPQGPAEEEEPVLHRGHQLWAVRGATRELRGGRQAGMDSAFRKEHRAVLDTAESVSEVKVWNWLWSPPAVEVIDDSGEFQQDGGA